ncbi:HAD family hydrolase [Leuconostoc falkenbergense]|uniref:HAD family hydrolase n=1 Tax=Leuconostoc falkenbergense TaxID=2766470 RepID=UPI002A7FE4A4|nr:HAD family hydrolase [Leuconostoc falkenbergense]MDY5164602.1 HAD family hydrolase [Leuconostoc falkenbergense]
MTKLIVTDMDGTFLNDHHNFDTKMFEAILELCQKKNVQFAVASGSQYMRLVKQFEKYQTRINYICQNGASVYIGNRLLYSEKLTHGELKSLDKVLSDQIVTTHLKQKLYLGQDGAYFLSHNGEALVEANKYFPLLHAISQINDIKELYNDNVLGMAVIGNGSITNKTLSQMIQNIIPNSFSCLGSGFDFYLIQHDHVDKVVGVKNLQEYFNVAPDDTIVFGNNYNDLKMLESTSQSFIMSNSPDDMKSIFNVLDFSNNQNGVQKKILSYLENI